MKILTVTKSDERRHLKFLQANNKTSLFQDVMPHSLADMYRHAAETCWFHLQEGRGMPHLHTCTHITASLFFLVKACYNHQPLTHLQLWFLSFPPNSCHLTGIPILPWRWGQQFPPRRYPPTKLHGVTSHKTAIFRIINKAVPMLKHHTMKHIGQWRKTVNLGTRCR